MGWEGEAKYNLMYIRQNESKTGERHMGSKRDVIASQLRFHL